jgi:hypothetical protein
MMKTPTEMTRRSKTSTLWAFEREAEWQNVAESKVQLARNSKKKMMMMMIMKTLDSIAEC